MARKNNTTKREIDMGAYVYKLAGRRNYLELNIEGKQELVFELEYWWKPSWGWKDEYKPKNYNSVVNRIKKQFKDEPVRFVKFPDGYCVFKITHDDFTDVLDSQLGFGCYPAVDPSLIK